MESVSSTVTAESRSHVDRPRGDGLSVSCAGAEGVGEIEPADDERWLRRLYDVHGPELHRLGRRLLGDEGGAEDLVQDVLLRAWRNRQRYDPALASERTWLFAIARHAAVDALRSRSARPSFAAEQQPGAAGEPAVPDEVDRLVRLAELRDALATLQEPVREAVVLTHGVGLSYEESGHRLGIPAGTVKSRVHNGLRQLRREIVQEGG